MKDIYCTYFDHNYLSRALLTIDSLRRQREAAQHHREIAENVQQKRHPLIRSL